MFYQIEVNACIGALVLYSHKAVKLDNNLANSLNNLQLYSSTRSRKSSLQLKKGAFNVTTKTIKICFYLSDYTSLSIRILKRYLGNDRLFCTYHVYVTDWAITSAPWENMLLILAIVVSSVNCNKYHSSFCHKGYWQKMN